MKNKRLSVTCISDLHGWQPVLEGGDLLIIAGDLTARDLAHEHDKFYEWLHKQEYRKKILIAGNHDNLLRGEPFKKNNVGLDFEYLFDSSTEFEGLKIYGTPWTFKFPGINPHCAAFTGDNKFLAEKFSMIPDDADILVTHSPAYGILDKNFEGINCGSTHIRAKLEKIKPKLHVCGHIHESHGKTYLKHCGPNTWCVNASIMNENYLPKNKPIRIDI